jgi:hypothetical protein
VDWPPLLRVTRREREMCFYVRGKDERDREHTWRIAKEERGMENIPRIGG